MLICTLAVPTMEGVLQQAIISKSVLEVIGYEKLWTEFGT
jgi:hypothetical protein